MELQGHGGPVILDLLLKRILTIPGLRNVFVVRLGIGIFKIIDVLGFDVVKILTN